MKKILIKMFIYAVLLVIALEIWVRIFHLAKDTPTRYLDEYNVEKWMPNQNGYEVTGNRRQNFSAYHINASGYNSYREFNPTQENFEIALVGDSFIEGFHQNFYNSIGKKIENKLPNVEVYEYGYAGYDMADQLHLIDQYQDKFNLIDVVVLGLKYTNDLERDTYEVKSYRLALESPMNKLLKKSDLLVYMQSIGAFSSLTNFNQKLKNIYSETNEIPQDTNVENKSLGNEEQALFKKYTANLESLMLLYGFNKEKLYFLLDETKTPKKFLEYLMFHELKYITIGAELKASAKSTTLIYDEHWNANGREIVAKKIAKVINNRAL